MPIRQASKSTMANFEGFLLTRVSVFCASRRAQPTSVTRMKFPESSSEATPIHPMPWFQMTTTTLSAG